MSDDGYDAGHGDFAGGHLGGHQGLRAHAAFEYAGGRAPGHLPGGDADPRADPLLPLQSGGHRCGAAHWRGMDDGDPAGLRPEPLRADAPELGGALWSTGQS